MEHQQLQLVQPRQGLVVDGGDAVEPTGTQNTRLRMTVLAISAVARARTHTPSPQVYTACVLRQARRYGEQGSKSAVHFAGLVAVAAPGTGGDVGGQQKHQAAH